jgi:phosphohistidine phosphatase
VELYLIRHADAIAVSERGITEDEHRPLSEKGENQAQAIAQGLWRRGILFDKLVTSPLLRAKQTAEVMLKHGPQPGPELLVTEALAPDAKTRQLAKFLRKQGGAIVGLVGHLPHIAEWAAWIIGGKKAQIDIAKAGVACIVCAESPRKGTGVLQWLVTPEWLGS